MTNSNGTGKPIPDDWDGVGYVTYMLCAPDSPLWRGYVRGAIYDLTRGRKWDENTGSVLEVQAIAWGVYDSMANCNELADKFDGLIDAVNNISVSLFASASSSGGGCCGQVSGGSVYPVDGGVEGQDPPEGFESLPDEPGSPEYDDRKCKVANIIHAQIYGLVVRLADSEVLRWFENVVGETVGSVLISSIIGYILGELSTPFPLIDGLFGTVIGAIAGLIIKLAVGDVDLDELMVSLLENEEDLVCALYSGHSAAESTNDYLQVLSDAGVSLANREVVLAIMLPRLINVVFFKSREVAAFELELDGYVSPIPCGGCLCTGDFGIGIGTLISGDLSEGTAGFTILSETDGTVDGVVPQQVSVLVPDNGCCYQFVWSMSNRTLPGFNSPQQTADHWFPDCDTSGVIFGYEGAWSLDDSKCVVGGVSSVMFRSGTSFTLTVTVDTGMQGDCP